MQRGIARSVLQAIPLLQYPHFAIEVVGATKLALNGTGVVGGVGGAFGKWVLPP